MENLIEFMQRQRNHRIINRTGFGECPICYGGPGQLVPLSCGDLFCLDCTVMMMKNYMNQGMVSDSEFACPKCSKTIINSDAAMYLSNRDYSRLKNLRDKYKTDRLVAEGKAEHCPVPDCRGYVEIIDGKIGNECLLCRTSLCILCKMCSHPNLTCEEYAQNDCPETDLIMNRDFKRCPFCQCFIAKGDNGCNFISCMSPVCREFDRAVCYLCGKGLNETHHFSHYVNCGPFGRTCNTIDGIDDTPTNPELIRTRRF